MRLARSLARSRADIEPWSKRRVRVSEERISVLLLGGARSLARSFVRLQRMRARKNGILRGRTPGGNIDRGSARVS